MASLIIRVTHSGSSQEYSFHKLGPIMIGSSPECDLHLDDPQMPSKLLEAKLSAGRIFIKEVGARAQILLNSVVLPHQENCHYHEGEAISLKDTDYKIQIYSIQEEEITPPPFFENEFKDRLLAMNMKIQQKEADLKDLESAQNKKKEQLDVLDTKYDRHSIEKARLEVEISALRSQKENLTLDLRKGTQRTLEEEEKVRSLADHVKKLENEERTLRETIVSQNFILNDLKQHQEAKNKEISRDQIHLNNLERDAYKKEQEIKDLAKSYEIQSKEIKSESDKIQSILQNSQAAVKESSKIEKGMAQSIKEKAFLDHEILNMQNEVKNFEEQRAKAIARLSELRIEIEREERNSIKVHENILLQEEEEKNLKILNGEVRAELLKAEEKLSLKKTQLGQIDFQNQDANRKLNTVNFEIERTNARLKELTHEEKTHEIKMDSLKDELQSLTQRIDEEKEEIQQQFLHEKEGLDHTIKVLKTEVAQQEKSLLAAEAQHSLISGQLSELTLKHQTMSKEKFNLESQLGDLRTHRHEIEECIKDLKKETLKLEHDKSRAQRDLSALEMKLKDCENSINEKQKEAEREIENFKREERSRIDSERQVQLAEVETLRQKTLMEVESSYRKKLDDVHEMKNIARREADDILEAAHRAEVEITAEAQKRLKAATQDAQERETLAHERIAHAQNYLKEKEQEAETLLNKSRLESRDLMKKTEFEILDDLAKRKQKIRKFLSMKQETGLAHVNLMLEQQVARMKSNEEKAQQRLEDIKRRELKRIAKIRGEELSRQDEMKEVALKEFRAEKEKTLRMIQELKTKQEAELAEKKKTMLEHINSTKFSQQKNWEEEVKRERELFLQTKKDRINNATQAVMNVLVSELGSQGENEAALKDKIKANLQMAIDGQSAGAMKEMDQVLDFNPLKRKKVLPVLKKYALEAGIPAVIALIFLADIGSARTRLVSFSKDMMKQQHSASEMYVNQQKTEWKEKHSFNPEMTVGYKANYTDNLIYTVDFEKVMDNEEFQNDWILKVHDFMVKDLELSEDVAINYISTEGSLVKELSIMRKDLHPQFLDQGLKKMRDLETAQLGWLNEKLPTPEKMEKFVSFRKNYFDTFYAEKFNKSRGVASEVPSQTPAVVTPVP